MFFRRREKHMLSFCFSILLRRRRDITAPTTQTTLYVEYRINQAACGTKCSDQGFPYNLQSLQLDCKFVYNKQLVSLQSTATLHPNTGN